MDACNNGHFWMFHCGEVDASDRMTILPNGMQRPMLWAQLPGLDKDKTEEPTEVCSHDSVVWPFSKALS